MNTNTKTTLIVAGALVLAALPVLAGDAGAKFKEMDANQDGRVTREEYTATAKAHFGKLDTNADGIINAAELTAGQEKKGKLSSLFSKDDGATLSPIGKLDQSDQNRDGQITRAEHEAYAETQFAAWDTDKDGALTSQELEAGLSPKPMKEDKPAQPTP